MFVSEWADILDTQDVPKFCCDQSKNRSKIQEDSYFTASRLHSSSLKFFTFETTEFSSTIMKCLSHTFLLILIISSLVTTEEQSKSFS